MSWPPRGPPAFTALPCLNASRPVAAQEFQADGLLHTSPGQHPGFIVQLLSGCRPSACFIAKDESRLQRSSGFALVNPGRCPTAVELRKFPRDTLPFCLNSTGTAWTVPLAAADTSSEGQKRPAARALHGSGAWAKPGAQRQTQAGVAGGPSFDPDLAEEPGFIEPYLSAIHFSPLYRKDRE